ncbi:spore germination protein GerPC [Peribacillus alkalitolerans]|uniref:spore germination protein GerPC n=1 Tax=Peribacillus alkalitolerans TaxID=1550385 RepID=UPI0013D5AC63|nr:spore germination protein GerPC [Peribacillus alkalitolerans]
MHSELYAYACQMQAYLQAQERKIASLEQQLAELQKAMVELKNKPMVNVEKIEYKFDQLKVETLDGTLNIGLNPTDLQSIDEFAVNKKTISTGDLNPADLVPFRKSLFNQLKAETENYIQENVPSIIKDLSQQFQRNLDDSYVQFIQQDLLKQLDSRIDYYISQSSPEDLTVPKKDLLHEKIASMITTDISQAISTFIMNLPS